MEHKGWYRPRALPHFDSPELMQAITFRLKDSLPMGFDQTRLPVTDALRRARIMELLDAGAGSCILRDPANAEIVKTALLHGEWKHYELHAWVVMPNHAHVLITPHDGATLASIVQRWKSWTSKEINRRTGAEGAIWQRDYFDRFMRTEAQAGAAFAYIEENPVKAGLVKNASDWPFSSARR